MSEECRLCTLVETGLPAHAVYEDDAHFIMLDRDSLGFGHCMVIPKRHAAKVYELSEPETVRFFGLAREVANRLERALNVKAVAYAAFGSGLPHAHLHLVPHDDPSVLELPRDHARPLADDELAAAAQRLRSLLAL
jgi:histidine triad (HIT) family protein